jgi:hypothetical protein
LFAFRVAYQLGIYNVDDMLASAPYLQLREWRAFFERYHVGDDPNGRADLRMARTTSILANHWREKSPLKEQELMPNYGAAEQTPEQLRAALIARADRDRARTERRAKQAGQHEQGDSETVRGTRARSERIRQRGRRRDRQNEEDGRESP